ncbi:hypothetical protein F5X96DRAFT_688695, partial [Biscogniauxia mediterranea]
QLFIECPSSHHSILENVHTADSFHFSSCDNFQPRHSCLHQITIANTRYSDIILRTTSLVRFDYTTEKFPIMAANVMLSLDIFSISDLMAHHILHEFPSDVPELQPPLPSANVEDNSIRDVQSFAKAYPENLIPIGDSYCSKDLQQPVEVPVYHPIMGYAQQLAHRFTRADNWLSKVGPPRVFVDKENKFEAFLDEGQWNVTTQLVAGQGAMPPSRLWKVNRILEANKRTVGCIMYDDDSRDQNRNVASADRLLRSESICAFALAARQFQKYPDVHSMTVTLINFTASAMRVVQGGFVSCGHLKQPIPRRDREKTLIQPLQMQ